MNGECSQVVWLEVTRRDYYNFSVRSNEAVGHWVFVLAGTSSTCHCDKKNAELNEFIRVLYKKKIGEITSRWNDSSDELRNARFWKSTEDWANRERIEFQHAQVKLGDLFDYYTTNGVLESPGWVQFKYVVEDYLQNNPKVKYHPSRVQAFIEERGIDRLEEME
ncbi:hypothetical protein V7S43_015580 [Phytophthora oleae]|uniref:Uncharacterized protein n=1 Tax=Phytophthora oleae TaxID=2107226 RepID=A0ABD3EZ02_9STRA